MGTFGGPNLQTNNILIYLDSLNTKSYKLNQEVWNDLGNSENKMRLDNIIFDSIDSSLVLSNINSKLSVRINTDNITNITLFFAVKQKSNLTQIKTYSKTETIINNINQNIAQYNLIYKTFSKTNNDIAEKTYLNGIFVGESSYIDSNFLNSNSLKIQINTNGKAGVCKIQQFIIYSKVLSDFEILQNYNATKTRFGL